MRSRSLHAAARALSLGRRVGDTIAAVALWRSEPGMEELAECFREAGAFVLLFRLQTARELRSFASAQQRVGASLVFLSYLLKTTLRFGGSALGLPTRAPRRFGAAAGSSSASGVGTRLR